METVTTSFVLLFPAVIRVLLALVGLVVIGLRARGVPRGLGLAACALIALSGAASVAYAVGLPLAVRRSTRSIASLGVLTAVGGVFQLVGIALLIVAVCLRRDPPAAGVAAGYPPPPQPYPGPVPPPAGGPDSSLGSR